MSEAISTIDALINAERFNDARETIKQHLAAMMGDDPTRSEFLIRRARLADSIDDEPVDEIILATEAVLSISTDPELRAEAHARRIRALVAKRLINRTHDAVEQARAETLDHPHVALAIGVAGFSYWEHDAADSWFAAVLGAGDPDPWTLLTMARVHYATGALQEALAYATVIDPASDQYGESLRLRAAVHGSLGDHEEESRLLSECLSSRPTSDYSRRDMVALALATAAADRLDQTFALLEQLWRQWPSSPEGRIARARLESLAQSPVDDANRSHRLVSRSLSPTEKARISPAALELAHRFLPFDLPSAVEPITEPRSVPQSLHRITDELNAQGIETLRIECQKNNIIAAIDAGVPVIVQKEYDVPLVPEIVIGYDARLEVFIAESPHRAGVVAIPFRSGRLMDSGAIVVVGVKDAPETNDRAFRMRELGAKESKRLAVIDGLDRQRLARRQARVPAERELLDHIERTCKKLIEHDSSFGPAWYRMLWSQQERFDDGQVLKLLRQGLTEHGRSDWPHRVYGLWLAQHGRSDESIVAHLEAMRRAGSNAEDHTRIASQAYRLGRLVLAERHLLGALADSPTSSEAASTLSAVYLTALERLNKVPAYTRDAVPTASAIFNPADGDDVLRHHEENDLLARAVHFNLIALGQSPNDPINQEIAGFLALRTGQPDRAIKHFSDAIILEPGRTASLVALASLHEEAGRVEDAHRILKEATSTAWEDERIWAAAARAHARQGDLDAARATILTGLESAEGERRELVSLLFSIESRRTSRHEAALALTRLDADIDMDRVLAVSTAEELAGQTMLGPALHILRSQAALWPLHVPTVALLGRLLAIDPLTRDEGRSWLEHARRLDPKNRKVRVSLALSWLGEDPQSGLDELSNITAQDGFDHEARAVLLEAVGRTEEAAEARRSALVLLGTADAGIQLVRWHLEEGRTDQAADLRHVAIAPGLTADKRIEAERLTLDAHRLAGRQSEMLDEMRSRFPDAVAPHLAVPIYQAFRSVDHDLAARAANAQADASRAPNTKRRFEILSAGQRAIDGDPVPLRTIADEVDEDHDAWALIGEAWLAAGELGAANAATLRAVQLDPNGFRSLSAGFDTFSRLGELERAANAATQLTETFAHLPHGWERLAILHAKLGSVDSALELSAWAIDLDPIRVQAQASRAVALFAAGDLDAAYQHAVRALTLHPPERLDDGDRDELLVKLAVEGDTERLNAVLADRAERESPKVFADHIKRLRDVAAASRRS